MRTILIGYGVVGQSLTRIFMQRENELIKNYGFHPRVVAIADRGGAAVSPKGLNLEKTLSIKAEKGTVATNSEYGRPGMSALSVIENVDAEVIVEATPTNIKDGEPGLSHIETALKTGKHVVTTNKGPLALALPALTELADYNEVYLRFSGTVGGGTPVLDLAKRCLMGDRILSIRGILNGTTNYILTEMDGKHITFEEALSNAQKLGYAEADPSMDIDGIDAACKLVIMANWIMNKRVTLKNVRVQGIRNVTLQALEEAAEKDCTIKLIGFINKNLKVAPTEISKHDPLCVGGVL
ncbi:MAG: homoserine dehydrogenase, partial [Candidatus Bathyarchaeia archaeon]